MQDIFLIFIIISFSYIWFETNAFIEYCRLFGLSKIFSPYDKHCEKYPMMKSTYVDYLLFNSLNLSKFKSFIVKLVTCSDCLIVWLNLLTIFISPNYQSLGLRVFASWFGFYMLKIFKRKAHE